MDLAMWFFWAQYPKKKYFSAPSFPDLESKYMVITKESKYQGAWSYSQPGFKQF